MLIRNKSTFNMGGFLGLTFVGVLLVIFSPVFNGKNGLMYSDDLFNKLSKGSSYFIPKIGKNVKQYDGTAFTVNVKMDKPERFEQAVKIFSTVGAQVAPKGMELTISGDLGKLLEAILADSDAMYHNQGEKVSSRYQIDEKEVMTTWWTVLGKMDKDFKKQKKVDLSNAIAEVMKKAIEPAFNFYKIDAQQVSDKAVTMAGLLVFYVGYTLWWGYAIFFMFDGLGLSMKKAKVKKEV